MPFNTKQHSKIHMLKNIGSYNLSTIGSGVVFEYTRSWFLFPIVCVSCLDYAIICVFSSLLSIFIS